MAGSSISLLIYVEIDLRARPEPEPAGTRPDKKPGAEGDGDAALVGQRKSIASCANGKSFYAILINSTVMTETGSGSRRAANRRNRFPGASAVRETLACQAAEIHRRMESTFDIRSIKSAQTSGQRDGGAEGEAGPRETSDRREGEGWRI